MKTRSTIGLFWLLILVPALVLAGTALRLISHEQKQLKAGAIEGLSNQAQALAQTLDLTLATVQDNLTRALLDIAPLPVPGHGISRGQIRTLERRLTQWERTNPLVRNVFIHIPDQGLLYPPSSLAATREEREFIQRFRPLFRESGHFNNGSEPGESRVKPASPRQELYALSQPRISMEAAPRKTMDAEAPVPGQEQPHGWIPWFNQNRLHILGWVKTGSQPWVYGVELELMTLLSRMVTDFPANPRDGTALVLTDGNGSRIHQTGNLDLEANPHPRATLPLSPRLPHWQIQVFIQDAALGGNHTFFILALGGTILVITALLLGGVFMTRLTLDKARDAEQKTTFVASVSHELKTPLTSIRMYAELLLSGRIKDETKQKKYLEILVGESLRLTRLINNVLDFGRLEQKR
ncbi:MAG: hypothetical protein MI747_11370, partial [Desulfobacterales bacterium]|nr:hypothetical protein [Desulfobacterales bacterium]